MKPNDVCPICGGEVTRKSVEKLLRGGPNTACVTVIADVCQRCGERLYDSSTVRLFEEIRAKLQRGETADLEPLGRSYQVRKAS